MSSLSGLQPHALLGSPSRRPLRPSRGAMMRVRALGLTPDFGFVVATVGLTGGFCQFLAVKVAIARRAAGVEYPAMYATGKDEASQIFNCTQRAHLNTLEYVAPLLAMELALGLQYPIPAAGLGLLWIIGRFIYAQGYSTGDPKKRGPGGAISGLVYVAFVLSTLATGAQVALLH